MAAKKNKTKKVKQIPLPKTEQAVAAEVPAEKAENTICGKAESVELREPMTKKDTIMVVLYGLLMFMAMTVQTIIGSRIRLVRKDFDAWVRKDAARALSTPQVPAEARHSR